MKATKRKDYFEFARRDHIPLLMINFIGKAFVEGVHAKELGINVSFSAYRRMFNGSSVPIKEWNKYKEEVRKLLHKGDKIINLSSRQLDYVNEMIKFAEKYHKKDLSRYSNDEIINIIKDFHRILLKKCGHIQTYFAISDYLPELIASKIKSNKKILISYSTSPKSSTLIKEAKKDILRICAIIDKNNSLRELFKKEDNKIMSKLPACLKKDIINHKNKYGFLDGYYMSVNWLDESDVIEKIKSFMGNYKDEIKKIEIEDSKNIKAEKLSKELDEELKQLINISKHFAWLAFYADEKILLAFNYFKPVYTELAKRYGLTYDEIIESLIDEIHSMKIANKEELQDRMKNYILYCDPKGDKVYINENAKIIEQKELEKDKSLSKLNQVEGQPIFKGVVRGKAKIIILRKDYDKVENGDIIVSFNTNPTSVPFLEKAAALVTNEGGMLCHAAIVAREMNIPCIIGTKNATKVFKDGDIIEVDANKGIVKKV
ncbi:hypothetical protein KY343_05970 [Candidatus Woesearchaeota archaeon]|nr:hypothetical protein [Candidatus Woesearchaeota archaeon]